MYVITCKEGGEGEERGRRGGRREGYDRTLSCSILSRVLSRILSLGEGGFGAWLLGKIWDFRCTEIGSDAMREAKSCLELLCFIKKIPGSL